MYRQANIDRFESEMAKVNRGANKLMDKIRRAICTAPATLPLIGGWTLLITCSMHSENLRKNNDGTYSYMVAGKNLATITEESMNHGTAHDI